MKSADVTKRKLSGLCDCEYVYYHVLEVPYMYRLTHCRSYVKVRELEAKECRDPCATLR